MRKIIIITILVLISIFSMTGCESYNQEINETKDKNNFITISLDGSNKIYIHKETKVMYLFVKNGYGAGICVMVDENGKPLLWK